MRTTRKVTNQILELIEEGVLDPQTVVEACLSYMSEADMARSNELIDDTDEEED
jgi:hypothetical protein